MLLAQAPGITLPAPPPGLRLRLPRPSSLARFAARRRRLAIFLAVLALFGLGAGLWAYFTAPSIGPGASAKGGTVAKVTGLAGPTANPTANANVALSWNAALLSNGNAVDGYDVNRYTGSTPTAVCSSPVSGTSCTDSSVPDGTYSYGTTARFYNWRGP